MLELTRDCQQQRYQFQNSKFVTVDRSSLVRSLTAYYLPHQVVVRYHDIYGLLIQKSGGALRFLANGEVLLHNPALVQKVSHHL